MNEELNVAQKCTGCAHLVEQGETPRCADICPRDAIYFDEEDDPKMIRLKAKAEALHPEIAYAKGISNGDVVRVYNERGSVLFCAKVTERITPGTVYAEHGSKMDLYSVKGELVDRGGNINFISPSPGEKYRRG